MAILQKHGKNSSPDLVCLKEKTPDKTGVAGGHQKKWSEPNTHWPRPLARVWTVVLLLGTCLLYCARVAMPICAVSMAEKFNWTKRDQGMVLGSFFWGYCFTQVLGGYVSDRVGGEKVLLLSAAAWGAMTAFTPVLAHFCSQPIFSMTLARFLMGLLQGVHYPSLASLCSQKVVESERGFLMSTVGSGSYLGTLVIGGAGSLMLDLYGWESVFYVSGLLSVLWAYCMWKYLLKGEGKVFITREPFQMGCRKKICKSSWTFFGCLSDHLISKGYDTAAVRKLMQFFSMGVSSVFTILLCGTTTFPMAVAFVSVTMGLTTFSHSGVSVNVQDLAPSCAGALFGVMNTCGAFSGVLMVYFSGYLIEATGSWASVFALITVVNLVGLVTFLAFAEARRVDIDSSKGRYHNIHI
uniref:Solute carrier family 17 member 9b n=1 Tax=Hucho hucho TaxID=62062 RepID=A0A4W5MSE9_9TELE